MSFGRKGVGPGEIASAGARPAMRRAPEAADTAVRREAFQAEERDAGPLTGLRNGARPATRRVEGVGDSWNPISDEALRAARASRGGGGGSHSTGQSFVFGEPRGRKLLIAYLFWILIGQTSLHRFYCGQKDSACMQIALFVGSLIVLFIFPPLGGLGIVIWGLWLFADLFLMPGMMRRFKAEHGSDYRDFL